MIKKLALGLIALSTSAALSYAAAPAFDSAADATYNDGWQSTDNGGSGFTTWTLSAPGATNSTGGFIVESSSLNGSGTSGNIDTAGRSLGIYANSGIVGTANRSFTAGGSNGLSILDAGQTFSLTLDNGFIATNSSVGFNLLNAAGTDRFTFQFVGGQNGGNYVYNIGDGNNITTGVGFTTNGLTLSFTQLINNGFSFSITPNGGSATVINGTLTASDISQFQLFNSNAGSGSSNNAYFNSFQVVPEPSSLALLGGPAILGAWFYLRRRRA